MIGQCRRAFAGPWTEHQRAILGMETSGLVTLFGGSGFLGRHMVARFARAGARVRVVVRDPETAMHLKPLGDPGQIVASRGSLRDDASVAAGVAGAQVVVNLVGILYQSGRQTFDAVHVDGARRVAEAAAKVGASRLVQVSAIGASPRSPARYARSKAAGEAAVREAFPGASIVRPSIVFGPEDDFFNRFAALARIAWVLPLFGGGGTRFQPVYVGDVAEAVLRIAVDPATAGKTYELGGPSVYSFREVLEFVLAEIGRRRLLMPFAVLGGVPSGGGSRASAFAAAHPRSGEDADARQRGGGGRPGPRRPRHLADRGGDGRPHLSRTLPQGGCEGRLKLLARQP